MCPAFLHRVIIVCLRMAIETRADYADSASCTDPWGWFGGLYGALLSISHFALTEPIGEVDTIDALLPADDLTQHTIAPGSRVWVGFERFHVLPVDPVVASA